MAKTLLVHGEFSSGCSGRHRNISAHLANERVVGCVVVVERRQAASAFSTSYMGFRWLVVQRFEYQIELR